MERKIILIVVLLLAGILSACTVYNADDFAITVIENGTAVQIEGFSRPREYEYKNIKLHIPSHIQGLPVTSIGDWAFARIDEAKQYAIHGVTIPDGVTSIGDMAFCGNYITNLTIPESVVSIGTEAFSGYKLTTITIPKSVIFIGGGAFSNNPLTHVSVVPDNSFYVVENDFLLSKDGKQLVLYYGKEKNITIPNGVTAIRESTFDSNELTRVEIPDSVTSIGDYAFAHNRLTSISIPSSVTSIGNYAFEFNVLTTITIPDNVTSIGDGAFYGNSLTKIIIPKSVSVGKKAFSYNNLKIIVTRSGDTYSTSVTIPDFIDFYNSTGCKAGTYTYNTYSTLNNGFTDIYRWNGHKVDDGRWSLE